MLEEKFESSPFFKLFDEFMNLLDIKGAARQRLLTRYKKKLHSFLVVKIIEDQEN